MQTHLCLARIAALLFIANATLCHGNPIASTYSFVASGSLASEPFSNVPIVISCVGEASAVTTTSNGVSLALASTKVSLQGIGTFNFEVPLSEFFFDNHEFAQVGLSLGQITLSRGAAQELDLISGPRTNAIVGWRMATSIGPVTALGDIVQWNGAGYPAVNTTGGQLILNDTSAVPITFSATVVPEPTSFALLLVGVMPFASRRRRPTSDNRV